MTPPRSLQHLYPRQALVVLPLLASSTLLLFIGLSLPLLYSQKMFWQSEYSVWAGVVALWHEGERALATVLLFFSIVFPIVKLLALAFVWFRRLPDERRAYLLHWLGILGKWSMLDVLIVAVLIVLVKLGPFVKVEPRAGVYVFAAAILGSMVTTMHLDHLARRSLPSSRLAA